MARLRYLDHPNGERFDKVVVETVERWKESELSGDEWRFSYIVTFYSHGRKLATIGGRSIEDCLLKAASQFKSVKYDDPDLAHNVQEIFCCQPGCEEPWIVLKHPVKAYDKQGHRYAEDYNEGDARAFCQKHIHRGDCGLDDSDTNYVLLDT